jgi:glutamate N-acetyltransferase/amino-acid N-acetyltransferase
MMTDKNSITALEGVYANSVQAGIKKSGYDLSYIYVPNAVASAGVFTQNQFASSSVLYTKKNIARHTIKALLVNSGNSNTATGVEGEKNTKEIAKLTAKLLGLEAYEVAVSATGIIGRPLPMEKIREAIPQLLSEPHAKKGHLVAKGILTTDLVEKTVFLTKKIGKKTITVAGITKGSGMIAPNMATTLAYLVTNCALSSSQLQECVIEATNASYNLLSVDTDTSTSDMMLCFATGEYKINAFDKNELEAFQELLTEACIDLAKQIAKDGEGATKLIEVTVTKAASKKDAAKIAKQVIDSPLVKTAIHGEDPNWGRFIMAIGKEPSVKVNPKKVSISLGENLIFSNGEPVDYNAQSVQNILAKSEVTISIDLGLGHGTATAWGCDLTKKYIDINTEYN